MNNDVDCVTCERVAEDMASVLDGSAPAALLDDVAGCDTCRDARYDAERAELLMSEAGADFVVPEGLAQKLGKATATEPMPEQPTPSAPERQPRPVTETPPANAIPTATSQLRTPSPFKALAKRWTIPIFAAAAAAAILVGQGKESGTSADDPELVGPPWRGKVAKVLTHDGKLEVCAPSGSACRDAREGDEVPAGSQLRTDPRTLAELSFNDGSIVSLDRDTVLRLSTRGRGGELTRGGLVADVEHQENGSARFEFRNGHLDVLGTKFSLRSDNESATVHVARGQVRLSDGRRHDAVVLAGEEGRVDAASPPVTGAAAGLGEALGLERTRSRATPTASPKRDRARSASSRRKNPEKKPSVPAPCGSSRTAYT